MAQIPVALKSALLSAPGLAAAAALFFAGCAQNSGDRRDRPPPIVGNLRNSYFVGAQSAGGNFRAVSMSGIRAIRANFRGANLNGANLNQAILTGANFDGADLRGADLSGAEVTFATFRGAQINEATRLPDGLTQEQLKSFSKVMP